MDDLSDDADIVISHIHLTERAKASAPHARHFSINSFLDQAFYEELVVCLKQELGSTFHEETTVLVDMTVFTPEHIRLQLDAKDKWEAIGQVGEILIRTGHRRRVYSRDVPKRANAIHIYRKRYRYSARNGWR